MGKLSDKVAIITGAGSGMGRATALLFAREGASVVVVDRVVEGGRQTVAAIKKQGGRALFVRADVSRSADVRRMVSRAVNTYGKLDIMFNNAGVEQVPMAVADTPEEVWDRIADINLKGAFLGTKYAIPHLLEKGGVIINTASSAGFHGFPYQTVYAVTKWGVIGLTKSTALEYGARGIRVNCICPGAIQTPLIERTFNSPEFKALKPPRSSAVLGRLGTPEEIAQAALYLASEESGSYVTGIALSVDGGVTAV